MLVFYTFGVYKCLCIVYSAVECLYKLFVLQEAFALATPHKLWILLSQI